MKQWRWLVVGILLILAPAATAVAPSSSVTDASGDANSINSLGPDFNSPSVISRVGETLTASVPKEVLYSPTSFQWWTVSWNGNAGSPVNYDFAPSFGTLFWNTGTPSSTTDPVDGGLQPHQDIQGVTVDESGGDMLFSVTLGSGDLVGSDRVQLSMDTSSGPSAFVNIATNGVSPYCFASTSTAWGGAWRWTPPAYADILEASVEGIGSAEVTFHAKLATAVVAPQVQEGQPYFRWWIFNNGQYVGAWMVWDPGAAGWVGRAFEWDGLAMQVVGTATSVQVVGSEVWVSFSSSDFPTFVDGYEWDFYTGLMIGTIPSSGPALVWSRSSDGTAVTSPIFSDGFESGNLSAWSASAP